MDHRNRITLEKMVAHHYIDLDPKITWQTVTVSVPELKEQIVNLLEFSK